MSVEKEVSSQTEILLEWANKAIDYGVKNIPGLVQQYLQWWYWMHIVGLVVGVILLSLAFYCWYRENHHKYDYHWDSDEGHSWINGIIATVGFVIGPIAILYNTLNIIQIKVAPAVYIIDTLTSK